jgi:TldD protein
LCGAAPRRNLYFARVLYTHYCAQEMSTRIFASIATTCARYPHWLAALTTPRNCVALSRREFLHGTGAAAAALGLTAAVPSRLIGAPREMRAAGSAVSVGDAVSRDLAMLALDAAKSAGASYADARISRNNVRNVSTREQRVLGLVIDNETFGIGVRVLVDGAWGFAATNELTRDDVIRVAQQAVAQARANRSALRRPVTLAPSRPRRRHVALAGAHRSVRRADRGAGAAAAQANEAALKVLKPGGAAGFVNSSMFFLREEKTLATTDGTTTVQTIYRAQPSMTVRRSRRLLDFQSRQSTDIQPMGRGYEHVLDANLVGERGAKWATEAVEKLTAKSVEVGRYDLMLHPTHLWLTIHESVAHPTELDRALGYEANYAGTSFVAPPERRARQAQVRPRVHERAGDRSQEGSLGAVGWDDEGVKPETS